LELLRLEKGDPRSWMYYPVFEARVLAMQKEFHSRGVPETLRLSLQKRWIELPELCGYYLALEEDRVFAHACSWIENQFGVPFGLIYQCRCDEGFSVRPVLRQFFKGLNCIIERLNAIIPDGGVKISEVDIWTPWDAALWERLLHMTDVRQHYNVLRMTAEGLRERLQELPELLS
jgi:hypothetical protein